MSQRRKRGADIGKLDLRLSALRPLTAEEEFEVLLKAYELERLDDVQMASSFIGLLAPTLGLLSLMGFALVNAESIPKWLVALVPIAPLPFIAFGAMYAHLATVRGLLLDGYERALRGSSAVIAGGLVVPSGHHILGRVWNGLYSRIVIGTSTAALGSLYVAAIVVAFNDSRHDQPAIAWFGLTFSVACVVVLCVIYVLALWPERTLRRYSVDLRGE